MWFQLSFEVGRIDLNSHDMRSAAGEKFVPLLYSNRPIKGSVFADFAFVNMRLHFFLHTLLQTRFLDCDEVTKSHAQNPNLLRNAQTLLTRSRFGYLK